VINDDLGFGLRLGAFSPAEILDYFKNDQVIVYPTTSGSANWQLVEEESSGTSIMADLRNAGADDALLAQISDEIERARREGRTLDQAYELE